MAAGRVEIGFSGGQVVAVRISDDKVADLRKELDKADGWADLETEDGTVALDLREVVFVRGAPGEHRIGFTG
jgi:phosphosulfolactate synthase (CoM biosynthesis protein A)